MGGVGVAEALFAATADAVISDQEMLAVVDGESALRHLDDPPLTVAGLTVPPDPLSSQAA